jgi:hypothetical protein
MGILKKQEVSHDNPLRVVSDDGIVLDFLWGNARARRQDGYQIMVLAFDPTPERRARVMAEVELILFPQDVAGPSKNDPPARRPRPNQLLWIYEVENGNYANIDDYRRMMEGISFPLLPCLADPNRSEALSVRTGRIKCGLEAWVETGRTMDRPASDP